MAINPILFSNISASTAETMEGLLGIETLGGLGGVVFVIYFLYKLGTVETVLKIGLTAVAFLVLLYAAGFLEPSLQTANWYRLIAYVMEEVPNIILDGMEAPPT